MLAEVLLLKLTSVRGRISEDDDLLPINQTVTKVYKAGSEY